MQDHETQLVVRGPILTVEVLLVTVAFTMFAHRASAQLSSSGINGVVTDPSGAAIPSARVVLKNAATNVERMTISNDSGNYFFNNVPPANYTLTVSTRGFEKAQVSVFSVNVAQVVTLNVQLRVGTVDQSVTVEATNVEVESSTAQLGTTTGTQSVSELPLNAGSHRPGRRRRVLRKQTLTVS